MTNLDENTKKYRSIKKKLDNLEDVIKYEDIVQYADSVITVFKLPKDDQIAYYENHIQKLKEEQEASQKKEKDKTEFEKLRNIFDI